MRNTSKTSSSSSDSDDDVPLKKIKTKQSPIRMNSNVIMIGNLSSPTSENKCSELLQYSMETCSICQGIFHTRYDYYVHYAKHAKVKCVNHPIHTCADCKRNFITKDAVEHHNCAHKAPDILANILNRKLIVKCETTLDTMLKLNANDINEKNRILENVVNKSPIVKCDDSVTRFLQNNANEKNRILENVVNKSPIVKCDDSVTRLLQNNAKVQENEEIYISDDDDMTQLNNLVNKDLIVKCDATITKLIQHSKVEEKGNDEEDNVTNGYNDILEKMVNKNPVVTFEDTLAELTVLKRYNDNINNDADADEIFDNNHDNLNNIEIHDVKNLNYIDDDCIDEFIKDDYDNYAHDEDFKEHFGNDFNDDKLLIDNAQLHVISSSDSSDDDEDMYSNDRCNITSRLLFEESDDESVNSGQKEKKEIKKNEYGRIILGRESQSVHYDDLLLPGLFYCKRCPATFTSRFLTVIHETSHMCYIKWRPQYPLCQVCDRYIAGGHHLLKKHVTQKHPSHIDMPRKLVYDRCQKCHLRYNNYARHASNYHYIYSCKICRNRFNDETEYKEHCEEHKVAINCTTVKHDGHKIANVNSTMFTQINGHNVASGNSITVNQIDGNVPSVNSTSIPLATSSRPICQNGDVIRKKAIYTEYNVRLVCHTCCLFLKNRTGKLRHVVVKECSQIGTKQVCEICNKQFFTLKLVKSLKVIDYKKNGLQDYKKIGLQDYKKKDSSNTNMNRLKNIQHRLKALNKLTRF